MCLRLVSVSRRLYGLNRQRWRKRRDADCLPRTRLEEGRGGRFYIHHSYSWAFVVGFDPAVGGQMGSGTQTRPIPIRLLLD